MNTIIYYFSGTGNNLWVAEKLQQELTSADVMPFRHLADHKTIPVQYTHVIFCVPAYYSHIPPFVHNCLKDLQFKKDQKVISIVCCGGNRGHAIEDLRECITASHGSLTGEYMIVAPGNYILSYNAFPKFYKTVVLSLAKKKIHHIANHIECNTTKRLKHTGLFYSPKNEPHFSQSIAAFSQIGSSYTVSDQCVGCGICAKVCPVKNISLQDNKPVFSTACQQCMACIQWCPKQAIDSDHKAQGRTRYHHKKITLKELIQQNSH